MTNTTAGPSEAPRDRALDFIEQIEALGSEIEAAMAAIAGDRLTALEQSVRRQELACSRLVDMAGHVAATPSESLADPELAARLQATSTTLRDLNAQYAALLRHSGQSVRLLAALCTNYAGSQVRTPTWCCEV
jgi:hypothetical protein